MRVFDFDNTIYLVHGVVERAGHDHIVGLRMIPVLDLMHVSVPKGTHHAVDIIKGAQVRLEVLGHGTLELLQGAFFLGVAHAVVGKRRHEAHDLRVVLKREPM